MWQHKNYIYPESFSARYDIHRLVYLERFSDINEAIGREKQLKRWSRIKKIRLIVANNPDWRDLNAEWGKPVEPFSGVLRPPTGFLQNAEISPLRRQRTSPSVEMTRYR